MKIERSEIIRVYNQYPPNKLTQFMFKYFGKQTNTTLKKWFVRTELLLFFMGLFGAIIENEFMMKFFGIIFGALLILLAIPFITAYYMNNFRIRKIAKKLNLTVFEYNYYVNLYAIKENELKSE